MVNSAYKQTESINRPSVGIILKKWRNTNRKKVPNTLTSKLYLTFNWFLDYSKGFGGKFGVQSDRQDKSAVGWDHHEQPQKHESQTDHKIGFGGKFGLQTDRVDKSAVNEAPGKVGTNYTRIKPDIGNAKPSDLRAKFETMHTTENRIVNNVKPKQFDQSKTAFLTQNNSNSSNDVVNQPKQLDQSKLAQFNNSGSEDDVKKSTADKVREEIEELKRQQQAEVVQERPEIVQKEETAEEIYTNIEEMKNEQQEIAESTVTVAETEDFYAQEEIVDTGISATALYDYQAAADDEISFDPDDTITHIEQVIEHLFV